jgi:hypothetical protein
MEIETLDRRNLSEADARACVELLVTIWPKPGRTVETWTPDVVNQWKHYRGPEEEFPRTFVIRESGRVIAQASADPRTIRTSAGDITILALSRVCTDPAVRGRKLGLAVVRKSFELVDNGPFRFALFQTTEQVQPFYEAIGAIAIDNRFVNSLGDDPAAHPWWNPIIMRYPAGRDWPAGQIDLRGPGW